MAAVKNFFKKKDKFADVVILAVILVVFTGVFLFWGNIKSVNFCDEIYTYILSNSDNEFLTYQLEAGKWYENGEINHILSAQNGFQFGQVMKNNKGDVHPPMYYFVIHFLSVIFSGSCSKWIGLGANWIFAVVSLVVLYALVKSITSKMPLAIGVCLIYISSPAVLSANMFLRMYGMFSMWVLLFVYISYLLETKPDTEKKWHLYACLGAVTFFGFLTQYYFAVFCVIFTFFYCLCRLFAKQWKRCVPYVGSLMAAVIVATVFWKTWVRHMFSGYLGGAVKENAFQFGKIFHSIWYGTEHMFSLMYNHLGFLAGLLTAAAIVYLIVKKEKRLKFVLSLLLTALLYSVAVEHLTPAHLLSYRYFFPIVVIAYAAEILAVYFAMERLLGEKGTRYVAALCLTLSALNFIRPVYDKDSVAYVDLKNTYRSSMQILDENKHLPWIYFGYENAMMTELMYDSVMSDKFIMVNYDYPLLDQEYTTKSCEFLLFAEAGTEYEEDAMIWMNGWFSGQLEFEELMEKGFMAVYKVKHTVK